MYNAQFAQMMTELLGNPVFAEVPTQQDCSVRPVSGTKFWRKCAACDKLKLFGTTAKGDLGFVDHDGNHYCDSCAKDGNK